jgi:ATP-dependent Lon protease
MEVIEISGYSLKEKVKIGENHLIPKQLTANGISNK